MTNICAMTHVFENSGLRESRGRLSQGGGVPKLFGSGEMACELSFGKKSPVPKTHRKYISQRSLNGPTYSPNCTRMRHFKPLFKKKGASGLYLLRANSSKLRIPFDRP